jgi:hypothetical protein
LEAITPYQPPASTQKSAPVTAKALPRMPGEIVIRIPDLEPPAGKRVQPASPPRPAGKGKEAPVEDEAEFPVPGELLKEIVPGYETRRINGFTMLLSTQAIREGKKENGRPFQALLTEFDGIVKVLPPASLKPLRRVLIWIEWDNQDHLSPGTLAEYYGGGAIWPLDAVEQALKATGVEVLSLKKLAREKQLAVHQTRLVLLHELAHAVHHVFVPDGFNNLGVKFAYKQAMDRRLYDRVQTARGGVARAYAATNEAEYFAELSCAYLDRCNYYPFTRDELKEHDPTGYRVMEQVWGRRPPRNRRTTNRKGIPDERKPSRANTIGTEQRCVFPRRTQGGRKARRRPPLSLGFQHQSKLGAVGAPEVLRQRPHSLGVPAQGIHALVMVLATHVNQALLTCRFWAMFPCNAGRASFRTVPRTFMSSR